MSDFQRIDERQSEIARFYVELINAGEEIKRDLSLTDEGNERTKNFLERYFLITDSILARRPALEKLKNETKEKIDAEQLIREKNERRAKRLNRKKRN